MKKGYRISVAGYKQVLVPNHPRADGSGFVMEHIVVFEQATGVQVPMNCCVHHLNGDKLDNRPQNLCMMSRSAHTAFHNSGNKKSEETRRILSERAKVRFANKRNHPLFKEVDVDGMRIMRENGFKVLEICEHYGITKTTYYQKLKEKKL